MRIRKETLDGSCVWNLWGCVVNNVLYRSEGSEGGFIPGWSWFFKEKTLFVAGLAFGLALYFEIVNRSCEKQKK